MDDEFRTRRTENNKSLLGPAAGSAYESRDDPSVRVKCTEGKMRQKYDLANQIFHYCLFVIPYFHHVKLLFLRFLAPRQVNGTFKTFLGILKHIQDILNCTFSNHSFYAI